MKPILRSLLQFLLRFSGLPWLLRQLIQKDKPAVILFHDLEPDLAERTFQTLSTRYSFISIDEFDRWYRDPTYRLPRCPLMVTFDDGCRGNYTLLPLFEKYSLRPVIFLTTGFSGDSDYLSEKNIREMSDRVDFHSHTISHPDLTSLSDIEVEEEFSRPLCVLEKLSAKGLRTIAYPFGLYGERETSLADKYYAYGFTVDRGYNTRKTGRSLIKRTCITDCPTKNELIVKSSGLWDLLYRRKNKAAKQR